MFEQHTWTSGEKITAGKMNNLEAGVTEAMSSTVSGKIVETDGTLDKSYNDILAMVNEGVLPFIKIDTLVFRLNMIGDMDGYCAHFFAWNDEAYSRWYIAPDNDLTAPMIAE